MVEVGKTATAEVSFIHLIAGEASTLSKRLVKSPVLNDSGNPSKSKEFVEVVGGPPDLDRPPELLDGYSIHLYIQQQASNTITKRQIDPESFLLGYQSCYKDQTF